MGTEEFAPAPHKRWLFMSDGGAAESAVSLFADEVGADGGRALQGSPTPWLSISHVRTWSSVGVKAMTGSHLAARLAQLANSAVSTRFKVTLYRRTRELC